MKILTFSGSFRSDSANKKFAREAARLLQQRGCQAEYFDLKDYPMPIYDGDLEAAGGLPEAAQALTDLIASADALVLSTPEYNGSIPGGLKNVLDWLSRAKPMPLANKHMLLLAAAPGAMAGIRVLWHIRQPLEVLGMHVFPHMMGLPISLEAFNSQNQLKDEKNLTQLNSLLERFANHIGVKQG